MPEAKKTNTLLGKTILFQKSLQIHMKNGHRTVFQNAWSKKNNTHWKSNSVSIFLKFVWKKATEPSSKMPEATKNKHSLKKQFCFKKAHNFIWKKGTEPSSKMPEAKKTNTLFEKAILFQKEELNRTCPDYIEYQIFKFYVAKKIYIEYCHPTRPPQILIKKELKNWFLQLLARSWFCSMLFTIWILIKKVLKNWFFQLWARSGFSRMLFSIQFVIRKILKNWLFQLLASLGFGECFFLFKF